MVTIADFKKFVDGLLKPVTTKIENVDARIKALLPSDSDEIFLYRKVSLYFNKSSQV